MNIKDIEYTIAKAKDTHSRYFAIQIYNSNPKPELIINDMECADIKLAYYKVAYTDDLILKANKNIRIQGVAHGNSLQEIGNTLINYTDAIENEEVI